ncbi:beta-microseminoprotein [Dasypus novemcinctus]|uniref:beta-microseminoprotein n=1 Tax=Dasypus novemcinctus TaxID=9361 RepID=UPI00062A5D47|nr:beta-microseminoprotein [Dasypus novemcinctus]
MCGCRLLYILSSWLFWMHKGLKESCLLTMNSLLGILVVFATFVTLCDAACFVIPNEYTPGDPSHECKDPNGVRHQLNSEWNTEECQQCSCTEFGISCCSTAALPVGFDTDKCETIFHKETCSYTVVEKKNPEKTCPFEAEIM